MKVTRFLIRSDRAENSIMSVLSSQVSLILMAALGGLMFVLISGGARIQAENFAQTELRIANRAFITDVENASEIGIIDDTNVTLSSQRFLKSETDVNGDGDLNDYLCRTSQWFIGAASEDTKRSRGDDNLMALYTTISIHANEDCDSPVTSTQTKTAVSSITNTSRFVYTNIAGVKLGYTNGIVTSLNDTAYTPADAAGGVVIGLDPDDDAQMAQFRNDYGIDSWYTNDEIIRETPKIIEADLTTVFPITEQNKATLKASTDEETTELTGGNDNISQPPGEQSRWIPNPVVINSLTRGTTGPSYSGERESLRFTWSARPADECSPTQTLTYSWSIKDASGGMTSGETTGTSVEITSASGDANVWNGGHYSGTVSARCNDVDGSSTPATTTGVLSLPAPLGVSVTANSSNERQQTVSWESVSSDPSTRYEVALDRATATSTYTKTTPIDTPVYMRSDASWSTLGTTPSSTYGYNTTSIVPGFPETYRVKASTDETTGSVWSPGNYIYSSPAPAAPSITLLNNSSMTWSTTTCPAGNTRNYEAKADASHTADGNYAGTNTSLSFATIGEGQRVIGTVKVRCTSPYTLDPTNGQTNIINWSPTATSTYIRIVSAPSMSWSAPSYNYYWPYTITRTAYASCPSSDVSLVWSTPSYFSEYRASAGSRAWTATAYCQGSFTSSISSSIYITVYWIDQPTPTAPTGASANGGGFWHTSSLAGGGTAISGYSVSGYGSTYANSYNNQTSFQFTAAAGGGTSGWASVSSSSCKPVAWVQYRTQGVNNSGGGSWYYSAQVVASAAGLPRGSLCEA